MTDGPIINGYGDADADTMTGMPSDVEMFMAQHGVTEKYTCLLRVYSHDLNGYELVKKYVGTHPDPDEVGKQFGPGKYSLMFTWKGEDGPTGMKRPVAKEFKFALSEIAYRDIHEEYVQEQNELRQRKERARLETKKTEAQMRAIENGATPGMPVPVSTADELEKMMDKQLATAAKLANLAGGRGQDPMATLLPIILKQQETSMTMMMGMFTAVIQSMGGRQQGPGEGMMEMMKGFTGLLGNVVTMKRELDGDDEEEKESVGEKIFNSFVGFVPIILEKFAQTAEARRQDPLLNMAKTSPEYKAMKNDPAVLAAAVNRLDKKFSPKQTDKILEVMGLPRPEATKENYEKYREPDDEEAGQGNE